MYFINIFFSLESALASFDVFGAGRFYPANGQYGHECSSLEKGTQSKLNQILFSRSSHPVLFYTYILGYYNIY